MICTWIPLAILCDFLKVPLLGWGMPHDFPESSPAMDLKSPQGYSPFRFHSSPTLGPSCRRFLKITSEMTQNNKTHIQETDTTMARGKIITAQASSRFILYSPPGQNSRLYDQTCSVQRMCTNIIVQQKGVKFRPTAESVQSPFFLPITGRDW